MIQRRGLLAASTFLAMPAIGQGAWPNRPVRVIVGFPPGGSLDVMTRLACEVMTQRLGQSFVVETRSGASGNIGAEALARATPDGYTIGTVSMHNVVINPMLFTRLPFDPAQDFQWISAMWDLPNVAVVPAQHVPARNLAEFVAYARTRDVFTGTGAVGVADPTPSNRSANLKLGVGLQYAFNESVLLRGEAERYRNSDAVGGHGHVNLYSASLVFPFGRAPATTRPASMPAPMVMAATPAPMPMPLPAPVAAAAPAPMPAPVMAVPAPAPVRRVTYNAESLFGFDTAVVQPSGRVALDSFSAELAGTSYADIQVEGHTDRLGSTAYNQTLSQQRADAVKAYLVNQGKLDPAKVQAVGKGEGTPATQAGACPGQHQTAALIACLQPDRRVEIAVSGTR